MDNPYKLTRVPKDHWIFAACLNLVGRRGLTVDEVLDRLSEMSVPYELRYQWNDEHQEIEFVPWPDPVFLHTWFDIEMTTWPFY